MRKLVQNLVKPSLMTVMFAFIFISCEKDEPTLGAPPTATDAAFTYQASAATANIIELSTVNQNIAASWTFGNGQSATGNNVTATYPFAGTYTVTLTVQNSGGSASSSQDIVIENDDPSLIDNPIYTLLTGGTSKTWAIDSIAVGHFGVGPNPSSSLGDVPEYYAAQSLEKSGSGMYNDLYTFHIQGFGFDMVTNGDIYVNGAHAGDAPYPDTMAVIVGDFVAQHPDQIGENWTLTEGDEASITLSGTAMMAYWTGVRTYKIVEIGEDILVIRWLDSKNGALAWYATLRPEGFTTTPPPPPNTFSLPIDFEVIEPEFVTFGNSSVAVIANPDASGINTSSKVLETVHGDQPWSGLFVNLTNKLDFSAQTNITLKVWAPATGPFRLKLEERANTNNFVEIDVDVTVANAWQEITFDLTGTPTDFDRLVIFPGWNVPNAGTFYVDDINQE